MEQIKIANFSYALSSVEYHLNEDDISQEGKEENDVDVCAKCVMQIEKKLEKGSRLKLTFKAGFKNGKVFDIKIIYYVRIDTEGGVLDEHMDKIAKWAYENLGAIFREASHIISTLTLCAFADPLVLVQPMYEIEIEE